MTERNVVPQPAQEPPSFILGQDAQKRPTISMNFGPAAMEPAARPPQPPAPHAKDGKAQTDAAARPFATGDRVGHYELIRLLGRGGMGEVWLGRDTKLPRKVAIKFLHTSEPNEANRFISEGRATALCAHENIVTIFEVGEVGGRPFLALEYLNGQPLSALIADSRPMRPARAVELMVAALRGLQCAHEHGIVHRDLKPDNIVLTNRGVVKVLDFGIAKPLRREDLPPGAAIDEAPEVPSPLPRQPSDLQAVASARPLTLEGVVVGTPGWMGPEHWRGKATRSSDIWAAGAILFRMLAGRHPLEGASGMQHAIVAAPGHQMPSLRSAAPGIPVELAAIVDRCLRNRPEDRFPDVASLIQALERFLPGQRARVLETDANPYAGLSPFQEADADRFFGRDREIGALLSFIHDQPFTTVAGPSGQGKSSFVRAGFIPALKRSGDPWEVMILRPGRAPLAALAGCVANMAGALSSTPASNTTIAIDLQREEELVARLRAEPGYAGLVARKYAKREKRNVLMFVDQLEELYTLVPDAQERRAFTACLVGIADDASSPTRVVATIRSDLLDRVNENSELMAEVTRGLFFLGPPSREGLRDALVQPAEMAGYHFEKESIVEAMLAYLEATPGALPLLQFSASQLWESRDREQKAFTEVSYAAIGGVAGALARHADTVLSELSQELREQAKALLLRLVTPERTQAILSVKELKETSKAAGVERLVEHLAQARLLVIRKTEGEATAEIVHESLIHSWPTLRHWLDESGGDAAILEQLRTAAKQWQAKNRNPNLLWRGELVEDARRIQRRHQDELTALQAEFLQAVFADEARVARRKRNIALGGVAFLVLLMAAASIALVVIRRAQVKAVTAEVDARRNLQAALASEAERAEAARRAEEATREAERKNELLVVALDEKDAAWRRAEENREKAEQSSLAEQRAREKARKHEMEAVRAARSLEIALERERERAERLETQLGTPNTSGLPE